MPASLTTFLAGIFLCALCSAPTSLVFFLGSIASSAIGPLWSAAVTSSSFSGFSAVSRAAYSLDSVTFLV